MPIKSIPENPDGVELDASMVQNNQKVEYYMPFRITPNIEHFIGPIGI